MINFLLAGVGGQGIILAGDVLAEVGAAVGHDAKKSEIHGMSQRGGSVDCHVRWGERVLSPVVPRGEVNYLIAFEEIEGVRNLGFLAPGGVVLVNDQKIPSLPIVSGAESYPPTEQLMAAYGRRASRMIQVGAYEIALKLGKPAVVSTVMLGAVSVLLDIPESMWLDTIRRRVPPQLLEVNVAGFLAGRASVATVATVASVASASA